MPTTLTRIVRTGLSITVSTPAIAAQWTMCVAPFASSAIGARVEHVDLVELEVRVLVEAVPDQRVAVQVVDGDHVVGVDQLARERRRDEAGAAGDEDPLAFERHAASLAS